MYKIVKCSYCKKFQMSVSSKTFSCKFCLKKDSILKMRIYFQNSSAVTVNEVLKKIKEEDFKMKNSYNSDILDKYDSFESAFK